MAGWDQAIRLLPMVRRQLLRTLRTLTSNPGLAPLMARWLTGAVDPAVCRVLVHSISPTEVWSGVS